MAVENDRIDPIDRQIVDRTRRSRYDRYERCAHRLDERQSEHVGARRKQKGV
jgi:hypothetical protein